MTVEQGGRIFFKKKNTIYLLWIYLSICSLKDQPTHRIKHVFGSVGNILDIVLTNTNTSTDERMDSTCGLSWHHKWWWAAFVQQASHTHNRNWKPTLKTANNVRLFALGRRKSSPKNISYKHDDKHNRSEFHFEIFFHVSKYEIFWVCKKSLFSGGIHLI